jgi:hypothetical protein
MAKLHKKKHGDNMPDISKSIVDYKISTVLMDSHTTEKNNVITAFKLKVTATAGDYSTDFNFIVPLHTISFDNFIEFDDLDSDGMMDMCTNAISQYYMSEYITLESLLIRDLIYNTPSSD